MKLNSKILHIQLLYEFGFEDSLNDALESFRHFLNKNKFIPEVRKIPFSNFHKSLNKIIPAKNYRNKTEMELFHKKISKENNIINKKLAMEKIKF